jgi:uncharacterized protein involved in outer membrane biogenesis
MKFLKYSLLGLILLVAGVAAYLLTLDLNDYRDTIAKQAESATGRKLTIEGDLRFAASMIPTVVVEGVTFGNASWGTAPHMLKVGSFEARVALVPLLSKHVHVRRLALADVDVQLETNKDGTGNWALGTEGETAAPKAAATATPLTVTVDEVRIENAALNFRDGKTGATHKLHLDEVDVQAGGFNDPLGLAVKAVYDGMPVSVNGQVGSVAALTAGTGELFPVDLKADIGLKPPLSSLNPLAISAGIRRAPDGSTISFSDLKLTAGATALSGELTLARGKRTALSGRLESPLVDLTPFAGEEEKPKTAKVFSPEPLPLGALRAIDADLQLKVGELRSRDNVFQSVELPLKLVGGRLAVKPLKARHAGGNLTATLELDSTATPKLNLDLSLLQFEMGKLPAVQRKGTIEGGPADLTVKGAGSGQSVAAIMGGLNGKLLLKVGQGRIPNNVADKPGVGLILKTFGTLNPLAKSEPYSKLECGVVNFSIKDGIATTDKGIAVQTDKMTMVGSGAVNLKTEQLDLGMRPYAREGIGLNIGTIAGAGRIGGTLAEPKLKIDAANALKVGATAGAAVMTFGLSTLAQGIFDKQTADPAPCDTALGKAPAQAPAKNQPAQAAAEKPKEAPAPNPIKGATDAVKGALDGLFGN